MLKSLLFIPKLTMVFIWLWLRNSLVRKQWTHFLYTFTYLKLNKACHSEAISKQLQRYHWNTQPFSMMKIKQSWHCMIYMCVKSTVLSNIWDMIWKSVMKSTAEYPCILPMLDTVIQQAACREKCLYIISHYAHSAIYSKTVWFQP